MAASPSAPTSCPTPSTSCRECARAPRAGDLRASPGIRGGAVRSQARPGGNLTGFATINTELIAKRLGLLKETIPRLARVGVLHNPDNPIALGQLRSAQQAGRDLGIETESLEV